MNTEPVCSYVNMSLFHVAKLPHDILGHLIVMQALTELMGVSVCMCAAMPTFRVQERFSLRFLRDRSCGRLA
jgi:hypothetical protein